MSSLIHRTFKRLSLIFVMPILAMATFAASPWTDIYGDIERSIKSPSFQQNTYNIRDFGADVNKDAVHNGKSIDKAIRECSRNGGGHVIVPSGIWNTTPIVLLSGVDLHIEKDGTLLFTTDRKHFPTVLTRWEGLDCYNYQPLIYANDATDIAITGEGVIDGGAGKTNWWPLCGSARFGWKEGIASQKDGDRLKLSQMSEEGVPIKKRRFGKGHTLRPQLINFVNCNRVLVEGVTLLRSPFWVLHPLLCEDVIVRGVTFWNEGPNGDGCDPESCNRVLIEDCLFHTGDDCIAIKSGRNADGRRWKRRSENIIVRRCKMEDGHGGVVIGSEISGGCRNVFVEDCTMDSPQLERVIRIKTNTCRGGVTENVFVRNIEIGQCREAVLKINLAYEPGEKSRRGFIPTVRNVWMDSVRCGKSRYGVLIIGLDSTDNVYNINVRDCEFDNVEKGNSVSGMTHAITYKNLMVNGKPCMSPPCDTLASMNGIYSTYLADDIDTRTGTDKSSIKSSSIFGAGTENYGQTLPVVSEPNGMDFWTPQTRWSERKGVAPYYYSDSLFHGFRCSHWIVGGATQDYGSVTLSVVTDSLKISKDNRGIPFSHFQEVATPSYYSISLPSEHLLAEMTGKSRPAIFRITAGRDETVYVAINANSDEKEGKVEIDTLTGCVRGYNPVHRIYQGWGDPAGFSGHFVFTPNKKPESFGTYNGSSTISGNTAVNNNSENGIYLAFKLKEGEQLIIKGGTSFTSAEAAENNMMTEIPHWNFDMTRSETNEIWQRRLSAVQAESADRNLMRKFYGSLYRCSLLPRTYTDANGIYPSFSDGKRIMHTASGHEYYDDFSMWDTYRALHPLLTILTPSRVSDMMQSLVDKYAQGGWMPIFPCWNSYTAAMIGDHCSSVIAEAYMKGITGFDEKKAYEGLRQNAFVIPADEKDYKSGKGRRALSSYIKYGYIPLEDSVPDAFHKREQVSRTLEYSYDDYCLSQLAQALGYKSDAKQLKRRSYNYRNVFDAKTGYVQGRYSNGAFLNENNAFVKTTFITEGASCHYTWYVPHNPSDLISLMGGKEKYIAKLDSMFTCHRYWHGNEPCHQVAYMYNYADAEWKTQERVRQIMIEEYAESPDGLSGNDDAGQMSAWYVFGAMGFYPVNPVSCQYEIGSPCLDRLTLNLENGNTFVVEAENVSKENKYIQEAYLNGKALDRHYITHSEIMSGGLLHFKMGDTPKTK